MVRATAPEPTRPYLRADARRRQLLDAAGRLFVRQGYAGLTMVAIATEAGVSRRLVYDHFADVAGLYDAFFDDRAARYLEAIDRAFGDAAGERVAAFSGAFRLLLAMPADDQRVIRLLLADPGLPDLEPLRARFRAHVEARWLPAANDREDSETARALLWALVNGTFAIADLASRGEITRDAATTVATALVAAAPQTLR